MGAEGVLQPGPVLFDITEEHVERALTERDLLGSAQGLLDRARLARAATL